MVVLGNRFGQEYTLLRIDLTSKCSGNDWACLIIYSIHYRVLQKAFPGTLPQSEVKYVSKLDGIYCGELKKFVYGHRQDSYECSQMDVS